MIVILDYGMGNIGSIVNMYKRLGLPAIGSSDPEVVGRAERLVLPGVGAFDRGMENLERLGLRSVIERRVLADGVPVLGICLGMQLMTRGSEEGTRPGLGWIAADTVHLRKGVDDVVQTMRFPHIGWEFTHQTRTHPILAGLPENPRYYFVHTYKVSCDNPNDRLLRSAYNNIIFTAAVARDNLLGVQFHPEKSHKFGMQLLRNFANWTPARVENEAAPTENAFVSRTETAARKHRPRVIPVLLLKGHLLYKTIRFKAPKYVGDPRIAVKIFNEKGADELVLLDITATIEGRPPNFKLIHEVASEAFMPLAYGGGIRTMDDVRTVFAVGVEKVIVNTRAVENPDFITEAAQSYGSQSIMVSIDVKKDLFGRPRVVTHSGRKTRALDPVSFAQRMERAGAGEILVTCVDRDGTFKGYDVALIRMIASAVDVPVIACGGAGSLEDFVRVIREGKASAAAAGSFFVFEGPHRAVLITFPEEKKLASYFSCEDI